MLIEVFCSRDCTLKLILGGLYSHTNIQQFLQQLEHYKYSRYASFTDFLLKR
jgi:hypothetical protein